MIVDVHTHFVSPNAIDMARRKPDTYGIRINDMDHAIQLQLGDQPPIRPVIEPLYTLSTYLAFMKSRGITGALIGPPMDVVGYHLPPPPGSGVEPDAERGAR